MESFPVWPGVKIYAPQTEIRNAFLAAPCVLVHFFFLASSKQGCATPPLTTRKKGRGEWRWPMAISCCWSPLPRRQVHFISAFHFAPSKPPSVLLFRAYIFFFCLPWSEPFGINAFIKGTLTRCLSGSAKKDSERGGSYPWAALTPC